MAKDRKKLLHMHSSVADKQPTAASLEVGEIAVNNAKDQEFLSIKNSNDKVVRFSSDEQIVTIMEKKGVIPYSGTVDNVHLDTNRSNIEIKLNQVVAGNTIKHDTVNGARDIDGDLVNPTDDEGLTNGAGFAIDMSRYAMIGANPSFSSVTTTDGATLKGDKIIISGGTLSSTTTGDTVIRNSDNSKFILSGQTATTRANNVSLSGDARVNIGAQGDVNVESTQGDMTISASGIGKTFSVKAYGTKINGFQTNINADNLIELEAGIVYAHSRTSTCVESNNTTQLYGSGNTVVGQACNGNVGKITRIGGNEIVISGGSLSSVTTGNTTLWSSGNTVINADGRLGLTSKGELMALSTEGDIAMTANNDICESAGGKLNIYGVEGTNIGIDCEGNVSSSTTIASNEISLNGNTKMIGDDICVSGGSEVTMGAETVKVGYNCNNGIIANTLNTRAKSLVSIKATNSPGGGQDGGKVNVAGFHTNIGNPSDGGYFTTIDGYVVKVQSHGGLAISGTSLIDIVSQKSPGSTSSTVINIKADNTRISGETFNVTSTSAVTLSSETINIETPNASTNSIGLKSGGDIELKSYKGVSSSGVTVTLGNSALTVSGNVECNNIECNDLTAKYGQFSRGVDFCDSLGESVVNLSAVDAQTHGFSKDTLIVGRGDLAVFTPNVTGGHLYVQKGLTVGGYASISGDSIVISRDNGVSATWGSSCLNIDGNLCVSGTITSTGAVYSSDRNIKENISRIGYRDIMNVERIPLVSFNFKDDETKRKVYGVIAQDVEAASLNELVHTKEDGTLGVDYTSLMILKLAYLEEENHRLRKTMRELDNRIKKLEEKENN